MSWRIVTDCHKKAVTRIPPQVFIGDAPGFPMSHLIFKYGTMKSGKTLQLLQLLFNYASVSKNVMLAKPTLQRATDEGYAVSRASMEHKVNVDYLFDASFDFINDMNLDKVNCIMVDESQFLTTAQVNQLKKISQEYNIEVICYGLLTDFKSHLFEGSKRLIEQADILERLPSWCYHCRKSAGYNMRYDDNGNPVFEGSQIREDDVYYPVCWNCYNNKHYSVKSEV